MHRPVQGYCPRTGMGEGGGVRLHNIYVLLYEHSYTPPTGSTSREKPSRATKNTAGVPGDRRNSAIYICDIYHTITIRSTTHHSQQLRIL